MALIPESSVGVGTVTEPDVVEGDVATGAADSGNPVKVGGKAGVNAGLTAVTGGQRQDLWLTANGAVVVGATWDGTAGSDARTALLGYATRDGDGNGTVRPVAVGQFSFNGTTWDRRRSTVDATLLASAARTATANSSDQTNYNGRGVMIVVNTTVEGAATLTLTVQGKDSISGSYYDLITGIIVYTAAADTPPIIRAVALYPGVLTADCIGAGNANLISQKSVVLPRTWRVTVTPADATTTTYSVSGVTIL